VFGTNHVMINNYAEGCEQFGILLPTDGGGLRGKPDAHYKQAVNCLVAHNTTVDCGVGLDVDRRA
jgi:hypothetical protein